VLEFTFVDRTQVHLLFNQVANSIEG